MRYRTPSRAELVTVTFADMARPKSKTPKTREISTGATTANSTRPWPRARRCDGRRLCDDDTLPPESLIRWGTINRRWGRTMGLIFVIRTRQSDQAVVTGRLRSVTAYWRPLVQPVGWRPYCAAASSATDTGAGSVRAKPRPSSTATPPARAFEGGHSPRRGMARRAVIGGSPRKANETITALRCRSVQVKTVCPSTVQTTASPRHAGTE